MQNQRVIARCPKLRLLSNGYGYNGGRMSIQIDREISENVG